MIYQSDDDSYLNSSVESDSWDQNKKPKKPVKLSASISKEENNPFAPSNTDLNPSTFETEETLQESILKKMTDHNQVTYRPSKQGREGSQSPYLKVGGLSPSTQESPPNPLLKMVLKQKTPIQILDEEPAGEISAINTNINQNCVNNSLKVDKRNLLKASSKITVTREQGLKTPVLSQASQKNSLSQDLDCFQSKGSFRLKPLLKPLEVKSSKSSKLSQHALNSPQPLDSLSPPANQQVPKHQYLPYNSTENFLQVEGYSENLFLGQDEAIAASQLNQFYSYFPQSSVSSCQTKNPPSDYTLKTPPKTVKSVLTPQVSLRVDSARE